MKTKMKTHTTIKYALLAVFAGLFLTASAQAATFTVDRTDDATVSTCVDGTPNDCTLRGAITAANAATNADIIEFDATVFNTPQTITLSGTQLSISTNTTLTINGPGANLLTISGNNASRVFSVAGGATVQINMVTVSEGFNSTGSGISNSGNLTLNNTTVSNNGSTTVGVGGGGIFSNGGTLTLNNSTVTNNRAASGTGVGISSTGSTILTLNNSIVSNNDGDADLTGNAASGGGISVGSTSTANLNNSTVSGNISGNGNGIFVSNSATLTLTDSTVSGNIPPNRVISQNGGGIFNVGTGTITLIRSTISNNVATVGGGIANGGNGNLIITDSTISGNTASGNNTGGGGISASGGGAVTLTNSTVSGNMASAAASFGGGISNISGNTVTLTNSTVSNNSSSNPPNGGGGGIFTNGANSVTTLDNTIVANSTSGGDCFIGTSGGTVNASYSLIEDGLGCVNGTNSNNLTGDPNLGALANNGGPTLTHRLLTGSIAVDQGNSTLTTDQRGFTRPVDSPSIPNASGGNGSDIGSFEEQAPTAASVSVAGRVRTPTGKGLVNAFVTLTDSSGNRRLARTTAFGYFHFEDVSVGETYIVGVFSKRYRFTPQVLSINQSITDLELTGENIFFKSPR